MRVRRPPAAKRISEDARAVAESRTLAFNMVGAQKRSTKSSRNVNWKSLFLLIDCIDLFTACFITFNNLAGTNTI